MASLRALGIWLLFVSIMTDASSGMYDVLVYDASSGGVMAAVAAARQGMRTVLLCASWPSCYKEGGQRIGGMSAGGLGMLAQPAWLVAISPPHLSYLTPRQQA